MMASGNKELYKEEIKIEHERFAKLNCFEETLKTDLKPDNGVINGTWVCRFKPSGSLPRCRITGMGFEKTNGLNVDSTDVAALVIYDIIIYMSTILCRTIMAG